jgi:hypothetical protein
MLQTGSYHLNAILVTGNIALHNVAALTYVFLDLLQFF